MLVQFAQSQETLGGQLLYTGELNPAASHLIRAANIAGAASSPPLPARRACQPCTRAQSTSSSTPRRSLRILKNEIRKRQPVAAPSQPHPKSSPGIARARRPPQPAPARFRSNPAAFAASSPKGKTPAAAIADPSPQPYPWPQPHLALCICPSPPPTPTVRGLRSHPSAHLPPDQKAASAGSISPAATLSPRPRYRSIPLDQQTRKNYPLNSGRRSNPEIPRDQASVKSAHSVITKKA